MDAAPPPPRGRWRALLVDADVFAQPPHALQRVARVVYLAAAAALLVWTVREQSIRPHLTALVGVCAPLVLYAALLGLTVTRFRAKRSPAALFGPTLVLVTVHAGIGLSGAVCLAAYGTAARAFAGVGGIPLVACYFALLGGLLLGVLLLATARRAGPYVVTCVGVLGWLLVAAAAWR